MIDNKLTELETDFLRDLVTEAPAILEFGAGPCTLTGIKYVKESYVVMDISGPRLDHIRQLVDELNPTIEPIIFGAPIGTKWVKGRRRLNEGHHLVWDLPQARAANLIIFDCRLGLRWLLNALIEAPRVADFILHGFDEIEYETALNYIEEAAREGELIHFKRKAAPTGDLTLGAAHFLAHQDYEKSLVL